MITCTCMSILSLAMSHTCYRLQLNVMCYTVHDETIFKIHTIQQKLNFNIQSCSLLCFKYFLICTVATLVSLCNEEHSSDAGMIYAFFLLRLQMILLFKVL